MALRDLVLNNFRWKLTALILAIFVWFIIQTAIQSGNSPFDHPLTDTRQTLTDVPILVVKVPGDRRMFEVQPKTVNVTVRVKSEALKRTVQKSIKVFVDLTEVLNGGDLAEILTYAPAGVEILAVDPPQAGVKRILDNAQ